MSPSAERRRIIIHQLTCNIINAAAVINHMASEYKEEGSLRLPLVPCTHDTFFHYLSNSNLRIRDILSWALRTETTIRLGKVYGRSTNHTTSNHSKTLNSDNLIDIYPDNENGLKSSSNASSDKEEGGKRQRHDEYKFSRKAHPQLTFLNEGKSTINNDDDFDGLTPIIIEKSNKKKTPGDDEDDEHNSDSGYNFSRDSNSPGVDEDDEYNSDSGYNSSLDSDFDGRKVVPPTLLHFEIILEAYMGYNLSSSNGLSASYYHHPGSTMPRAAVMGGAVVAALKGYQDEMIVNAFNESGLFNKEGETLQMGDTYLTRKTILLESLHSHYIQVTPEPLYVLYRRGQLPSRTQYPRIDKCLSLCRKFSDGDVDVFLQASPLTQGVIHALDEHGIVAQHLISLIGSYVGNNFGLCDKDLENYTQGVMKDVVAAPTSTLGYKAEFAFTVSKSAASFILGKAHRKRHYDVRDENEFCEYENRFWPRTSQFILLNAQADLLGGLMDFDISVAACSYDGISVRVAPRAALSLMTNALFITPFCLEEHRNKSRVIKYARRGYKPFLVDPYDSEPRQKVACDAMILRQPFVPTGALDNGQSDEMLKMQDVKWRDRKFCCHMSDEDGLAYEEREISRFSGQSRLVRISYTQGNFLSEIFAEASITPLQEPKRPPIGLNPERFVETCSGCKKFLIGNRYGSKDCQSCKKKLEIFSFA
eukprot:scaffold4475_cov277-Chaetoceros_neogracile.AAC.2